jgi:hypothetical protein
MMKNISFSSRSEKTDFQACAGSAEGPTGFPFKVGWTDVEMGPFSYFAVFLLLDAAMDHHLPHAGSLRGSGCIRDLPAAIPPAALADCLAVPADSGPTTWRTPGNTSPWRLSTF